MQIMVEKRTSLVNGRGGENTQKARARTSCNLSILCHVDFYFSVFLTATVNFRQDKGTVVLLVYAL